jgi:hypothetical protein
VTKRYNKRTHNFGVEVPKSWDGCVRFDKENGNTFWQDAARKEMKNIRNVSQILNGGEAVPSTYQYILCHMIFDVKMEDFCHKARFIAGGHITDTTHVMPLEVILGQHRARLVQSIGYPKDCHSLSRSSAIAVPYPT